MLWNSDVKNKNKEKKNTTAYVRNKSTNELQHFCTNLINNTF